MSKMNNVARRLSEIGSPCELFLRMFAYKKWWNFSLDSQDEENDVFVAKEQRRYAHSAAEQKRRDAIRVGLYLSLLLVISKE